MYDRAENFTLGLVASQDINDFIPAGVNADSQQMINTLFAQCQYKFLLKQDSKALPSIDSAFGGSLTQSELAMIPTLNRGEVILNISGDKMLRLRSRQATMNWLCLAVVHNRRMLWMTIMMRNN